MVVKALLVLVGFALGFGARMLLEALADAAFDDQDWERELNDRKTTATSIDALLEDDALAAAALDDQDG